MKIRESAGNYLKTIFILQKRLGEVRSIDVANELHVSKPSVSNAVKKLRSEGFLTVGESHNLILTEDGFKYAASIFERHITIEKFLRDVLSIEEKTAHSDACRMEHLISTETCSKIKDINLGYLSKD